MFQDTPHQTTPQSSGHHACDLRCVLHRFEGGAVSALAFVSTSLEDSKTDDQMMNVWELILDIAP